MKVKEKERVLRKTSELTLDREWNKLVDGEFLEFLKALPKETKRDVKEKDLDEWKYRLILKRSNYPLTLLDRYLMVNKGYTGYFVRDPLVKQLPGFAYQKIVDFFSALANGQKQDCQWDDIEIEFWSSFIVWLELHIRDDESRKKKFSKTMGVAESVIDGWLYLEYPGEQEIKTLLNVFLKEKYDFQSNRFMYFCPRGGVILYMLEKYSVDFSKIKTKTVKNVLEAKNPSKTKKKTPKKKSKKRKSRGRKNLPKVRLEYKEHLERVVMNPPKMPSSLNSKSEKKETGREKKPLLSSGQLEGMDYFLNSSIDEVNIILRCYSRETGELESIKSFREEEEFMAFIRENLHLRFERFDRKPFRVRIEWVEEGHRGFSDSKPEVS